MLSRRRIFLGALVASLFGGVLNMYRRQNRWDQLFSAYQRQMITADGRVMDCSRDYGVTTSEGQAYALFFALVARDRLAFTKILHWTDVHLCDGRLGDALPAWKWGQQPDGHWGVLDSNSASDADSWLAYTLLQAGRIWRAPAYTALGTHIAQTILKLECLLPAAGDGLLLPGTRFFPHEFPVIVNPSYWPQFLLDGIAHATALPGWIDLARTLPATMARVCQFGFAPDWAWLGGVRPGFAGQVIGIGSYDAIRCYLWAGMTNPGAPGADQILRHLGGMAVQIATSARVPVKLSQDVADDSFEPIGFLGAVLPFLAACQESDRLSAFRRRLATYRQANGLYGAPAYYYDQNLILFGLGFMLGKFSFSVTGELL
jgi:endoglucanase